MSEVGSSENEIEENLLNKDLRTSKRSHSPSGEYLDTSEGNATLFKNHSKIKNQHKKVKLSRELSEQTDLETLKRKYEDVLEQNRQLQEFLDFNELQRDAEVRYEKERKIYESERVKRWQDECLSMEKRLRETSKKNIDLEEKLRQAEKELILIEETEIEVETEKNSQGKIIKLEKEIKVLQEKLQQSYDDREKQKKISAEKDDLFEEKNVQLLNIIETLMELETKFENEKKMRETENVQRLKECLTLEGRAEHWRDKFLAVEEKLQKTSVEKIDLEEKLKSAETKMKEMLQEYENELEIEKQKMALEKVNTAEVKFLFLQAQLQDYFKEVEHLKKTIRQKNSQLKVKLLSEEEIKIKESERELLEERMETDKLKAEISNGKQAASYEEKIVHVAPELPRFYAKSSTEKKPSWDFKR